MAPKPSLMRDFKWSVENYQLGGIFFVPDQLLSSVLVSTDRTFLTHGTEYKERGGY